MAKADEVGFTKVQEDERIAFGVASMALKADGAAVVDRQGDIIPAGELEKAQYQFMLDSRAGGTMHGRHKDGSVKKTSDVIESFVATPEKLIALMKGLGIEVDAEGRANVGAFKGAATWLGVKVHDEATWGRVKSGELRSFSIAGNAGKEAA